MTKEIITISPYSLDKPSGILNLLKNPPPTTASAPRLALTVPTLSSLDTSTLVNLNTTRIHSQDSYTTTNSTKTSDNNVNDIDSGEEQELTHYVPLSTFNPTSLKDQVNTIIVKNITNLPTTSLTRRLAAIERLLNMCMNIRQAEYSWSIINHELLLDLNLVFVRFVHTSDVSWFLKSFDVEALFGGEVITNEQFKLDDTFEKSQVPDVIKSFQLHSGKDKKSTVDESQEILNYYKSQYKVDNSELVDIPNSMKEATILNILKFRSRVLIMEKENRKRDLEKERMKTREKLKNLFEEKQKDAPMIETEETNKEIIERDEFEDMDEEEYKEYLEFKQDEELTKQYEDALAKIKIKESQRAELLIQLEQVTNYEDNLIDNKLKYIDDIKNQDLNHIYYTNYNHYLKLRNSKRTLEQTNDEIDRKEEHVEKKQKLAPEPEPEHEYEHEHKHKHKHEPEPVKQPTEKTIQINIDQLQPKIIELIKEYLGIHDDFLLEVINEHLSTHGLANKTSLVEELTQVLDEDAVSLVDDVWGYIKK